MFATLFEIVIYPGHEADELVMFRMAMVVRTKVVTLLSKSMQHYQIYLHLSQQRLRALFIIKLHLAAEVDLCLQNNKPWFITQMARGNFHLQHHLNLQHRLEL